MAVTICQESLLRLYLYEMLSHQENPFLLSSALASLSLLARPELLSWE